KRRNKDHPDPAKPFWVVAVLVRDKSVKRLLQLGKLERLTVPWLIWCRLYQKRHVRAALVALVGNWLQVVAGDKLLHERPKGFGTGCGKPFTHDPAGLAREQVVLNVLQEECLARRIRTNDHDDPLRVGDLSP